MAVPGLAALFCCPLCGAALEQAGRILRCENRHAFDIAAEGYVNLLLAQHRRSKDPGYSREMIAGRRAFFAAGHYKPLATAVADLAIQHLPPAPGAVVLDAGCGEGYYLRRLRAHLAAEGSTADAVVAGLDVSKHCVRAAAKADPAGLYAMASTHRMPVIPEHVSALLTHFSPVSPEDFRRVVRTGGVVIVGGPGEGHLLSLKELLYDKPAGHEGHPVLAGEPGFELISTRRVTYALHVNGSRQVGNLLLMTPFFWSARHQAQARIGELRELRTDVDVVLHAYRRVSE